MYHGGLENKESVKVQFIVEAHDALVVRVRNLIFVFHSDIFTETTKRNFFYGVFTSAPWSFSHLRPLFGIKPINVPFQCL